MVNDIRWKQRFENFEKALNQLQKFIDKGELNEFEIQVLIQCFEYTFELSWSVMKDFLLYQGITTITGSRDAIREAFNKGLIADGENWMNMIEDRILSVHTYNEETAEKIEHKIYNIYFNLFKAFYLKMKSLL
jgi:nucleotidyltransferase substrate binding protein (TIGR01987 family)